MEIFCRLKAFPLVFIIALGASCTGSRNENFYAHQIHCYRWIGSDAFKEIPQEPDSTPAYLRERFTENSLSIAYAIGANDLLSELALLEHDKEKNASEIFQKQIQIIHKINYASMDISGTAADILCEDERVEQILDYLDNQQRTSETRITAIAIGSSALFTFALVGIFLYDERSPLLDGAAIVGGVSDLILSLKLFRVNKKVNYYHKVNPLKYIFEGNNYKSFFSTSIWYYLNVNKPGTPGIMSAREQLLNLWLNAGQLSSLDEASNSIYFGDGGIYTRKQLRNRGIMLDQLEAEISVMQNDLKELMREVNNYY